MDLSWPIHTYLAYIKLSIKSIIHCTSQTWIFHRKKESMHSSDQFIRSGTLMVMEMVPANQVCYLSRAISSNTNGLEIVSWVYALNTHQTPSNHCLSTCPKTNLRSSQWGEFRRMCNKIPRQRFACAKRFEYNLSGLFLIGMCLFVDHLNISTLQVHQIV